MSDGKQREKSVLTVKEKFRLKEKIRLFETWMKGEYCLIHLDSRRKGVDVPLNLKSNSALTLKFSYNFQGDINYDHEGISGDLKFSGEYYHCIIPWTAIWGITSSDEKSKAWIDDMPREVLIKIAKERIKGVAGKLLRRKKDTNKQQDDTKPKLKRIK